MAYTQLSIIGTPGKKQTFTAKVSASPGKGLGPFTELSVLSTPGKIHAFTAKTSAISVGGRPEGIFTELSIIALSGMRHSFVAKIPHIAPPVEIHPEVPTISSVRAGGGWTGDAMFEFREEEARRRRAERINRIIRDDEEILGVLMEAVLSGILE